MTLETELSIFLICCFCFILIFQTILYIIVFQGISFCRKLRSSRTLSTAMSLFHPEEGQNWRIAIPNWVWVEERPASFCWSFGSEKRMLHNAVEMLRISVWLLILAYIRSILNMGWLFEFSARCFSWTLCEIQWVAITRSVWTVLPVISATWSGRCLSVFHTLRSSRCWFHYFKRRWQDILWLYLAAFRTLVVSRYCTQLGWFSGWRYKKLCHILSQLFIWVFLPACVVHPLDFPLQGGRWMARSISRLGAVEAASEKRGGPVSSRSSHTQGGP